MGGQQSAINYANAVSEKPQNGSKTYRSPNSKELTDRTEDGSTTLQQVWNKTLAKYPNNVCLAQRDANRVYQTKNYKEINEISTEIASGIINSKIAPEICEYKNFKLQMIGIYFKNRQEWMMIDVAAHLYGFTVVPLYDTLGHETIAYCLKHSGVQNMFCSADSVTKLLTEVDNLANLHTIISVDPVTDDQIKMAKAKNIKILTLHELRQQGKQNIQKQPQLHTDSILTFSYTSGTTGTPKAAMLAHKNFVAMLGGMDVRPEIKFVPEDVYLSYLPLPHVMDRIMCFSAIKAGASIWFFGGDVLKLKDDIADVRPTIFPSVPRLYNKFYDAIQAKFDAETGVKRWMIDTAISTKLDNLHTGCHYTHKLWDFLIFKKIRDGIFGGRVRYMATGSAPIAKDVKEFFAISACAPMLEGYGQTESIGASFLTVSDDPVTGHVGGVAAYLEFKVEDIPEMSYLSTDKNDQGEATPRGEVCLRGPGVFPGYYKDEEKTREAIDKDGWLHTGDVGVIQPNGSLKIVDRKKNIFKLAQGEYIAPEKIENVYLKAKGVAEAFVHGESLQATLVGVIVPDKVYLEAQAKELNIQGSFEQLCMNKQMIALILKNCNDHGKKEKLLGFEQIKQLYLEPKSFALHECFTSTMKLQRHKAKQVFQKQINDMYGVK